MEFFEMKFDENFVAGTAGNEAAHEDCSSEEILKQLRTAKGRCGNFAIAPGRLRK